MLLTDPIRKSIAFLYSGTDPKGTAFLVHIPLTEDAKAGSLIYAVTAGHVVEGARASGDLRLRINTKDGGTRELDAEPDKWFVSPSVDAAVAHVDEYAEELRLDINPIPLKNVLTDEEVRGKDVGEGDEVVTSGMFFAAPGTKKNLPIGRFGHIALMPSEDDPIFVDPRTAGYGHYQRRFSAYLVEAHSRGGHSGSPVFLVFSPDRDPKKLVGLNAAGQVGVIGLLGLVSAHYDDELAHQAPDKQNSGIAVVVPSRCIIDLLMHDELVKVRKEARKQLEAETNEDGTDET